MWKQTTDKDMTNLHNIDFHEACWENVLGLLSRRTTRLLVEILKPALDFSEEFLASKALEHDEKFSPTDVLRMFKNIFMFLPQNRFDTAEESQM